jgi:hypothetical protein
MRWEQMSEGKRRTLGAVIFIIVTSGWIYFASSDLGDLVSARYPGQVKIFVGGRDSTSGSTHMQTRLYILLPRVFSNPTVVTVRQENGCEPEVSEDAISWWTPIIFIGFVVWGAFSRRRKSVTGRGDR